MKGLWYGMFSYIIDVVAVIVILVFVAACIGGYLVKSGKVSVTTSDDGNGTITATVEIGDDKCKSNVDTDSETTDENIGGAEESCKEETCEESCEEPCKEDPCEEDSCEEDSCEEDSCEKDTPEEDTPNVDVAETVSNDEVLTETISEYLKSKGDDEYNVKE